MPTGKSSSAPDWVADEVAAMGACVENIKDPNREEKFEPGDYTKIAGRIFHVSKEITREEFVARATKLGFVGWAKVPKKNVKFWEITEVQEKSHGKTDYNNRD